VTTVRLLSQAIFADTITRAIGSPRGRTNHNLHSSADDPVHRFLNTLTRGTYVTPHRHVTPPKSETFLVLRGQVVVFLFDDGGAVLEAHCLGEPTQDALPCAIDLGPGIWHSIAALSELAICFEVKPGPYLEATDKDFAPFAPREGFANASECSAYLSGLLVRV
jgi:cupin fold WbuC family metalloprotein